MQAETEICTADDPRIVFGLEPSSAQLYAARRQPRKPALELRASRAVSRHQDHQIGEPAVRLRRFPASNPFFESKDGVDHHVEILIFGPARGTDDESNRVRVDAE